MRSLILLSIAAALGLQARAAEPTDSLASALATYWGSAINTTALSQAERDAFAKGFEENFQSQDSIKAQYIRGAMMAANISRSIAEAAMMGLDVNPTALAEAFGKVVRGGSVGFTPESAQAYIDRQIAPEEAREFSVESQAQFLATEAARPGAVTTPSGLVFQVLTEGEGPMPTDGDTVSVLYTGRLSDGSEFDSTDKPVDLSVSGVVPGMSEGLKMMKPGGRYRLVIPSDLGYGNRGIRGVIPGGAALDFTVELVGIKPSGQQ